MNIQLPNVQYVSYLGINNNVCAVSVDLSTCDVVTDNKKLRQMLTKIYGVLQRLFPKKTIEIKSLLVPKHNISGQSIMGLGEKSPIKPLEKQLQVLNFSETDCSESAILNLSRFPNLGKAIFDRCKNLNLTHLPEAASVQYLSLLDTKVHAQCIKHILTTFPNLCSLRLTLHCEMHYPLGLKNWQAHSYPQVSLYGGQLTLLQDVQRFPLKRINVEFFKENNIWNVVPLDAHNKRIVAGNECYIHTACSQLHSKEPNNNTCATCKTAVCQETLLPFHHELDPVVDMEHAFEALPQRPKPTTPWEIVERAVENQLRY